MTIAYVTKYALSGGIQVAEVVSVDGTYITVKWPGAWNGTMLFHRAYCHGTELLAINHANELRDAKIKSLQKQIDKLQKATFAAPPASASSKEAA